MRSNHSLFKLPKQKEFNQLSPAKTCLKTLLGTFKIQRLPIRKNETLQAWDAADELLINNLATEHAQALDHQNDKSHRLLIINDQFGALMTVLHAQNPDSWNDSSIAHLATVLNHQDNFKDNASSGDTIHNQLIASTDTLNGIYSMVLIKIPKTLALLEQQLRSLKQHINTNTVIIASGMSKHIHSSTLALFEKIIGETRSSRATKKARLIFCKINSHLLSQETATELTATRYFADPLNCELTSYANGFSRDRLDLGARAMIQAMDEHRIPDADNITDLACGNGVLGLHAIASIAKDINKIARKRSITFIDESYMAIAAAKENYQNVICDQDKANITPLFIAQDSIKNKQTDYDWIICNPPFHIGTAMDTYIANRMFQQSHAALQRSGQLWIVANRHLKYQEQIKRIFKNYKIILSNNKFVVISATKL